MALKLRQWRFAIFQSSIPILYHLKGKINFLFRYCRQMAYQNLVKMKGVLMLTNFHENSQVFFGNVVRLPIVKVSPLIIFHNDDKDDILNIRRTSTGLFRWTTSMWVKRFSTSSSIMSSSAPFPIPKSLKMCSEVLLISTQVTPELNRTPGVLP